jgi:hypothetical protein
MTTASPASANGFPISIRPTISTPSPSTSSAASTNAFSARSSSPPTNAPGWRKSPKSAKPAAFITRPNTSSATLSKTPSAN